MVQPEVHFEKQDQALNVCPAGRLDTATSPKVLSLVEPELKDVKTVVMDFDQVDYISSGGMRMLLAVEEHMEDCGGSMKLIHVNEYIRHIFDITGLSEMIRIE